VKVLVTGATGFVGGAIARALAVKGYGVRALVRPGRDTEELRDIGVETVEGDLLNQASLAAAVDGVEGVFHAAAVYAYWTANPATLYRSNVNGTKALLNAARRAGVRRAVFTSTVATLRWPGPGRLADERSLASLKELPGHYKRSKWLAEQAALAAARDGLEVVVVNPTAPFGPGDARPTPTGRIVLEFLRHRMPGYVQSGINVVHVSDVAEGHVAAFERGRPGVRYILGNQNLTLAEVYGLLGEVTGLKRRPLRVPYWLAYAAGAADALIEGRLLGREPYVPLEGLRVARHPMYTDCSRAVAELGLPQTPAAEALESAARWYVDHGYVSERTAWRASGGTL